MFQSTNKAMNKSNPIWLWPGKFSDDCSPLTKWSNYLNGSAQTQFSEIDLWSRETHIGIHRSGPKRPFYYIFRKDSDPLGRTKYTPLYDADIRFGDTKFDRKYVKRQLGHV